MNRIQRVVVLGLLSLVLLFLIVFPVTRPVASYQQVVVIVTALFMLSFTVLLFEHFFAKPTDVIAAAVSILTLLIPSRAIFSQWGQWYWAFLYFEIAAAVLATIALLLLTSDDPAAWHNRVSDFLHVLTTRLASGKIQYFGLFFLSLVFFIQPRTFPFLALLLYALAVFLLEPQRTVNWLPKTVRRQVREAGEILAVEGGDSFVVRLHESTNSPKPRLGDLLEFRYKADGSKKSRRGVVVERMFLEKSEWVRAVCHESINEAAKNLPDLPDKRIGAVYRRPESDGSKFFGSLVGFVADKTCIGTLRFYQTGGTPVLEGDLVEVASADGPIVYQVVDAVVDSESLDARNESDFVVGEGVQLGRWETERGVFVRHGWVPAARAPVTRLHDIDRPVRCEDEVELGCIPGTKIPVFLNKREAISHHTAILGVTGVGKSVFARQLIRQLSDEKDVRVIVVDFTREWTDKLRGEPLPLMINDEAAESLRKIIRELDILTAEFKNNQEHDKIRERKKQLFNGFKTALDEFLSSDDRVRVFELPDVSNTEGILEYTQQFFQTLFHIARKKGMNDRRVCVVLEEAHTVIPEWNFVGIAEKSSQSLVNNISQIALQGRKYNVGFIVIAQRTASVSKTVLTQCNTIIAFQCFDGTSLEFLGHYLPTAVVNSLPNLGFRRAVAVGKAIRGSVPLIFEVPDLSDVKSESIGGALDNQTAPVNEGDPL